jgi:hypothetical protein
VGERSQTPRDWAECGYLCWTVSEYVQRGLAAGLTWPLPDDLSEEELNRRLFPQPVTTTGRVIPQPDWTQLHQQLRRPSVKLRLLWVEYREANPDGYGYSQFCRRYEEWRQTLQPTMRLNHKAGERLFVDYAGQTLPVTALHDLLPADTQFLTIEGGDHAQFGAYGPQPGDNPASIPATSQWDQTAQATLKLLESLGK